MSDLKRVISADALLALSHVYGGLKLRVPRTETPGLYYDAIARVIGPREARELIRYAGSTSVYIPLGGAYRELRDQMVLEMSARGRTATEIAQRVRYEVRTTERHVSRILARGRAQGAENQR